MAMLDWSECSSVERVPGTLGGAWVLRGTRMPVATIFENLEAGASLDDFLSWYDGLERTQVQAVIEFAARSLTPTSPHARPDRSAGAASANYERPGRTRVRPGSAVTMAPPCSSS